MKAALSDGKPKETKESGTPDRILKSVGRGSSVEGGGQWLGERTMAMSTRNK